MPTARIITAVQARDLDAKARDKYGIPTLILMENAGRAVAQEALRILGKRKGRVAIFCGRGNNGGDGFTAARHLLTSGVKPDVFLAGKISDVKGEAAVNAGILLRLKQKISEVTALNVDSIRKKLPKYYLIVDALLGVGLSGEVRGIYCDLIRLINLAGTYVLSVDIPSGLDATSGIVFGCCVEADETVTFIARKRGMACGKGPGYCGMVKVEQLGVKLV
ncbi:MAG: NAD(P)H-hydrate epimerase [Candidatus Omnitrophota bacterium]